MACGTLSFLLRSCCLNFSSSFTALFSLLLPWGSPGFSLGFLD